jgi:hypothetical protein
MAIVGDVVMTVFAVQGVGNLVSAYARLGNAQQQAQKAEREFAATAIVSNQWHSRLEKHLIAQRTLLTAQAAAFSTSVLGLGATVFVGERAVNTLVMYGRELQNIIDLTGAAPKEASAMMSLFKVAGLSDITEIREIMKLNQAIFSSQGRSALTRLGVAPDPNQSGIQLFMQVADALDGMEDGLRKTQIMQDIFGTRGIAAILPLLRMTREQRAEVVKLSESFNTEGLSALQSYGFAVAFLGQTILVKLVFPIAKMLLPLFEKVVQGITFIVDQAGGFLAWVITVGALAFAFTKVILAVQAFIGIMKTLIELQKLSAYWQAILNFLSNPVYGAAVAAAAVAGTALLFNNLGGGDTSGGAKAGADKFDKAVDKFSNAVERIESTFEDVKGRGIPGGMGAVDIGSIERQFALHVIG